MRSPLPVTVAGRLASGRLVQRLEAQSAGPYSKWYLVPLPWGLIAALRVIEVVVGSETWVSVIVGAAARRRGECEQAAESEKGRDRGRRAPHRPSCSGCWSGVGHWVGGRTRDAAAGAVRVAAFVVLSTCSSGQWFEASRQGYSRLTAQTPDPLALSAVGTNLRYSAGLAGVPESRRAVRHWGCRRRRSFALLTPIVPAYTHSSATLCTTGADRFPPQWLLRKWRLRHRALQTRRAEILR